MRQGQAATEMLIIFSVALIILVSTLAINSDLLSSSDNQISSTKTKTAINDIADAAEYVYQGGIGSKTKVYVALPNGLKSINISDQTIKAEFLGDKDAIYRNVDFMVSGIMYIDEGFQWVTIESMDGYVSINGNGTTMSYVCGNNIKEFGEVCDGTDLGVYTTDCSNYPGFDGGTLSCLIDCSAYDTSACTSSDTTPPNSITNLMNISRTTSSIYWTWTNPTDLDFSEVIIYIDGINVLNTSNNYYNATGLTSNTSYTITIHTKDLTGNVNMNDVSNTASTEAYMDMIPPATITNLMDISRTTSSIFWTWTNPLDVDFSHVILYLDGINLINTSGTSYNFTGLTQDTTYNLSSNTVDTNGNVNTTFVWDLGTTNAEMNYFSKKLFAQVCNAAVEELNPGSFVDACDGVYPSACVTGGDLLSCDDSLSEIHTASRSGSTRYYMGVRIQSFDSTVLDCSNINSVQLCYNWWASGSVQTTDISIDANGGASYTAVVTSIPPTSDTGMVCTDVTSLETWSCSNFFGSTGTRALIKSEMRADGGQGARTGYWDVLYFNVTYTT
jgi:hypothetical protein